MVEGYTQSGNSVIDNHSLNYIHFGIDVPQAIESGVMIQRTHRSRNLMERSSFGPGVFCNFDISLDVDGLTKQSVIFDPANSNRMRFSSTDPQDDQYKESPIHLPSYSWIPISSENLYSQHNPMVGSLHFSQDAQGTPARSTEDGEDDSIPGNNYWGHARFAELRGRAGEKYFFQLLEDRTVGYWSGWDYLTAPVVLDPVTEVPIDSPAPYPLTGRLVKITDQMGRSLTISYESDEGKEFQIIAITDYTGAQLEFDYADDTVAGNWVVSEIRAPGDLVTNYEYLSDNEDHHSPDKLTSVSHTLGTSGPVLESNFAYGFDSDAQCITVDFDDPVALLRQGGHRKKRVYLTHFAGQSAYELIWATSVNCVRMVVNGEDEVAYLSLPIPNGPNSRHIYEGGGKMKLIAVGSPSNLIDGERSVVRD